MKYSVLTYIFGNSEILREAPIDTEIEYICVTDNKELKSDSWKIIYDEDLKDMSALHASFYVRYHPFKYCSGEYCIRLDGSIQINKSLLPIFKQFENSNKDMCVMTNSRAHNLLLELLHWIGFKPVLQKQLELYKDLNINILKQGSLQSPFSIVKNNDICTSCDALCWKWIQELSSLYKTVRPSQALMTAAVYKTEGLDVMFVSEELIQSEYMQWCQHNSSKKRVSHNILKHTKFFDQPIEIYTFK